jgi:hypothetical protein
VFWESNPTNIKSPSGECFAGDGNSLAEGGGRIAGGGNELAARGGGVAGRAVSSKLP